MTAWRWIAAAVAAEIAFVVVSAALVPHLVDFNDTRHHVDFTVGIALPVHVVWQPLGGWTLLAAVWGLAALLAWFGWQASRALADAGASGRTLLLAQSALLGVLLAASVTFSGDIYAYVIYGRLYGIHGINPYLLGGALPDLGDATLRQLLLFYGNPPPGDNYGPLWTLLAGAVSRFESGASLAAQAWTHRVLAALGALAATAGLLRMRRSATPAARVRSAGAFAFNPVILYESAVGGHNDLLMVAAAVWAFALTDELPLVAGLLLGASIAVKYVSVVLVPFLAIRAGRRNVTAGVLAGGIALALPALFFRPFWSGPETLYSLLGHGGVFAMSPQWLLNYPFFAAGTANAPAFGNAISLPLFGQPSWPRLVQIAATLAFAAVAVMAIVRYAKSPNAAHVWRTVAALVYSLPIIHPWYVSWTTPAAAGEGRWATFAWWFGVTAFLRYALDGIAPVQAGAAYTPMLVAGTVLMLGIPVVAALRDKPPIPAPSASSAPP